MNAHGHSLSLKAGSARGSLISPVDIRGSSPSPVWAFCSKQWSNCRCEGDIRWGNDRTWHTIPLKGQESQEISCDSAIWEHIWSYMNKMDMLIRCWFFMVQGWWIVVFLPCPGWSRLFLWATVLLHVSISSSKSPLSKKVCFLRFECLYLCETVWYVALNPQCSIRRLRAAIKVVFIICQTCFLGMTSSIANAWWNQARRVTRQNTRTLALRSKLGKDRSSVNFGQQKIL